MTVVVFWALYIDILDVISLEMAQLLKRNGATFIMFHCTVTL